MTYYFICECGEKKEIDMSISKYDGTYPCDCGKTMTKDWTAQKPTKYQTRFQGAFGKPV